LARPFAQSWWPLALLLQLAVLLVIGDWLQAPPAARGSDAPAEVFSAGRAMRHVEVIAAEPHPTGSAANQRVRDHLVAALRELGLDVELQRVTQAHTYQRGRGDARFATVENIIGTRRGLVDGPMLLLMSHYDSVPTAPGAGDAASGVATILETLRALGDEPLRNTVRVLFTDGEEIGLFGAQAYFGQHPDAAATGLVLNFDARGSHGPVAMFETSEGNAALIGSLASAAPLPLANSMVYSIYRQMPNDTDLSISKVAGHAGMNFALVHGHFDYHSPTDRPANLSLDTLQHLGSYALPLTRHFGNAELPLAADADVHYFNPLGHRFVHYPPWVDLLLLLVTGMLFAVALWRARQAGRVAAPALLRGGALALAALLLPLALVWFAARSLPTDMDAMFAVLATAPRAFIGWAAIATGAAMLLYGRIGAGVDRGAAVVLAAVLLGFGWWSGAGWNGAVAAVAVALLVWIGLRRPLSGAAAAFGALLVLLLAALALAVLLPPAAHILLWPLVPVVALHALLAGRMPPMPLWLLVLLPAMLLLGSAGLTFDLLIGHAMPAASVLPLLLVLLLGAPLLATPTATVVGGLVLLLGVLVQAVLQLSTPWSERQPQPVELFVLHDHDAGESFWASTDRQRGDWHRERLGDAPQAIPLSRFAPGAVGSAAAAPLGDELLAAAPMPRLLLLEDRRDESTRHLRLRLSVDGPSDAVSLFLPAAVDLRGWRVAGQPLQLPPAGRTWRLRGFALPREGVELELELGDPQAALPTVTLTSTHYALPPALVLPPRPTVLMRRPYSISDSELSVRRIDLEAAAPADADTADARHCSSCEEWNAPQPPFRIHGNTYYVGPRGLSALLIAGDDGHVLLDGALPQSAPLISASIAALGLRIEDVRWILLSHAHFDHAGGIAALQRASGAQVGATPLAAAALRRGNVTADDPQAGEGAAAMAFPPVAEVVEIADGESVRVGALEVTALHTPGHTPGGSSWHWQSCEDGACRTFVYADSLTPVSSDGFRFSDDATLVASFERSIARIGALDCTLLVSTHPGFSGLFERLQGGTDADPFVDPAACRDYAGASATRLRRRLAQEQAELATAARSE
jgi:glyoxylase-like metal-dependent hydrolase (beta-lactamase superfamily II)